MAEPINKVLDENYVDLIINNEFTEEFSEDGNITRINSRYSIIHIPEFEMCMIGEYPYAIFPSIFSLNSTTSLEKSGVLSIQSNPNFALHGQGVMIGIVDTGIDYRHEAFLNRNGSSRIYSIWDQTIQDGPPPQDKTFGTEYTKEMIDAALKSDDPLSIVPTRDDNGHGTMLAGIAAGNVDLNEAFSGVAPEAELIVVNLKKAKLYNRKIYSIADEMEGYQESDLLLGITYVVAKAAALEKPLVLCIALGTSQGDHNGNGILAAYLNSITFTPRVAVCISAGNQGNSRRHYQAKLSAPVFNDSFELRVGESDKQFYLEIWNHDPCRLFIEITSPNGESTRVIYPSFTVCRQFRFIFSSTVLYVNNFIMEESSGAQLILIRFENAASGIWTINIQNTGQANCTFDAWLPAGDIITKDTFFLKPDPNTTITTPGNARNPLTITAYNQSDNSILASSSRGFSASNGLVPDLAAPGYQLKCPRPEGSYGSAVGTGTACAHAAGIVAMLMEWAVVRENYTTITGRDVSRLLIRGALRDSGIVYPNQIWGYGRINIEGVFDILRL